MTRLSGSCVDQKTIWTAEMKQYFQIELNSDLTYGICFLIWI